MLLQVEDLHIRFGRAADAVNGIQFCLDEGEILGLVGESGSGKTATAMSICGLLDRRQVHMAGKVLLCGQDMLRCSAKELRRIQGKLVSVVFQEPMSSFDPLMPIGKQVEEALRVHTDLSPAQRRDAALAAMEQVELPDPGGLYRKYPHELSGGMLQRAMIAAAIVTKPKLLIADEPTTALDVTTQRQILALLRRLNRENRMAILFISHDLQVVRRLCTRAAVMQCGQIVETGLVEDLFHVPRHPYTRALIDAIPTRDRRL